MVDSSAKVVVLDLGSDTIKAGFAGDEYPNVSIKMDPSVMKGGRVLNWDGMETLWGDAFTQLGVSADAAGGVLVTEAIYNPPQSKEEIVTRMFEKMNVQKCWVGSQPHMSLLASGRTTGLVVDSGHGLT